jgi:hypothetical protein
MRSIPPLDNSSCSVHFLLLSFHHVEGNKLLHSALLLGTSHATLGVCYSRYLSWLAESVVDALSFCCTCSVLYKEEEEEEFYL